MRRNAPAPHRSLSRVRSKSRDRGNTSPGPESKSGVERVTGCRATRAFVWRRANHPPSAYVQEVGAVARRSCHRTARCSTRALQAKHTHYSRHCDERTRGNELVCMPSTYAPAEQTRQPARHTSACSRATTTQMRLRAMRKHRCQLCRARSMMSGCEFCSQPHTLLLRQHTR